MVETLCTIFVTVNRLETFQDHRVTMSGAVGRVVCSEGVSVDHHFGVSGVVSVLLCVGMVCCLWVGGAVGPFRCLRLCLGFWFVAGGWRVVVGCALVGSGLVGCCGVPVGAGGVVWWVSRFGLYGFGVSCPARCMGCN